MIRLDFDGMRVDIVVRANAKKFILRYDSEKHCFGLTAPGGTSRRSHITFLEKNRDWMRACIASDAQKWQPSYTAGEQHLLWGTYEPLGGGTLPVREEALHSTYVFELTQELQHILPSLKQAMHVQVTEITLSDMRTRWGSCQPNNKHISLNLRLARLPKEYTYYVLAHEMCHLLHPNHSRAFYAELERFCPNAPTLRERIKQEPLAPKPAL